jgi:DNA polymerase-3 subunit delta'
VVKKKAALEFAAAICCQEDGCGNCLSCQKAQGGIHPDITMIKPAGSLITVDQIRELSRSLNLHPHESRARVFIISDAEALGAEGANAFLKSLEEPPPFVFFLLVAERLDRVLPTIASRCQVVRFHRVPPEDIKSFLLDKYNISDTLAQAYARISGGSLSLAEALCTDSELGERRQRYLRIASELCRGTWEGGAAEMAAEIEAAVNAAGEAAGARQEVALEGFEPGGQKRVQQDVHRHVASARRHELAIALDVLESWFRDMMVMAAGAGKAVLNKDYELELEDQALPSRLDNYRQALLVIETTRGKLGYNIDLGLALQAMFYQLTEVL